MAKNALEFTSKDENNSNWKKGVATFKTKDDKVKVILSSGESWVFSDKLLPKYPKEINAGEKYFVEFVVDDMEDLKSFENIRPTKWMGLKMKPIDMTRPDPEKLEPPAPYGYVANYNGKEVPEKAFYIFYECVDKDDEYYGVIFPERYMYKFKNDGNDMAMWDGNPEKSSAVRKLAEHLSTLGAVSEPIEWPDDGNLLPELLARIIAADATVETSGETLTSKKGNKFTIINGMVMSKTPVKDNSPVPKEEKRPPQDDTPFGDDVEDDDNW